jgi:hypothetical protein
MVVDKTYTNQNRRFLMKKKILIVLNKENLNKKFGVSTTYRYKLEKEKYLYIQINCFEIYLKSF